MWQFSYDSGMRVMPMEEFDGLVSDLAQTRPPFLPPLLTLPPHCPKRFVLELSSKNVLWPNTREGS